MPDNPSAPMPADPWARLRGATGARIGLGRRGDAIPLDQVLAFQLAHAQARDAVHSVLDLPALEAALSPASMAIVTSQAADRSVYLRRPDLGRRLAEISAADLRPRADGGVYDAVFVIADGLSATAVNRHAPPLIQAMTERLAGWSLAPLVVATNARVALGDEVGERVSARLCAVLIGERPGLSVPDSLGVYLTWDPRRERQDSERNCISNIHGRGGLTYTQAADKLAWLMHQARHRRLTGVELKDDPGLPAAEDQDRFPRSGEP